MFIPLAALFFLLFFVNLWFFRAENHIYFSHLYEQKLKIDIYQATHLSSIITCANEIQVEENIQFNKGEATNQIAIVSIDEKRKEKHVKWTIYSDGISHESSFIINLENGQIKKWNYR